MPTAYHVLIVDDDVELSTFIAEQLVAAGGLTAEIVTTIRAAEAAISAPTSNVSAILLDVQLPDGDGRDFCVRLRQNGILLPVIMVSGLDQVDDVVRGLDLGADDYMRKPFGASELIARLRKMLPRAEAATDQQRNLTEAV